MRRRTTSDPPSSPGDGRLGRRAFALGVASTFAAGCGGDDMVGVVPGADAGARDAASVPPADPDLIALHAFVGEGPPTTGKTGVGLDARLRLDLSSLAPDGLDVGADRFYVRTERPDLLPQGEPGSIVLGGLVDREVVVGVAELVATATPLGLHVMECSGNTREAAFGLLSATRWSGVPLADVLARVAPRSEGARVLVAGFDGHSRPSEGGHSIPGASWIFSRDELVKRGAFLATHMGGVRLLPDHGAPVRLYVPGYYGCACIKWVDRIDLVADDAPATSQMKEFAGRTHQHYAFELAREYAPPFVHAAGLCTRAEHRRVDGKPRLRLRGLVWGGEAPTTLVRLFIGAGGGDPVVVAKVAESASGWGMWEYVGPALAPGRYDVRVRAEPIATPQRRLDAGWYTRTIEVRG